MQGPYVTLTHESQTNFDINKWAPIKQTYMEKEIVNKSLDTSSLIQNQAPTQLDMEAMLAQMPKNQLTAEQKENISQSLDKLLLSYDKFTPLDLEVKNLLLQSRFEASNSQARTALSQSLNESKIDLAAVDMARSPLTDFSCTIF